MTPTHEDTMGGFHANTDSRMPGHVETAAEDAEKERLIRLYGTFGQHRSFAVETPEPRPSVLERLRASWRR